MPDVAVLHDAIIKTTNNLPWFRLSSVPDYHPFFILAAAILGLFILVSGSMLLIDVIKTQQGSFLGMSIVLMMLGAVVCIGGFISGIPHEATGTSAVAAKKAACTNMLDAVSSGNVRWMNPKWQKDVSDACGENRFAAAANSSSSRYASRM